MNEETMWAARCHGPGERLVVERVPRPVPGKGQVLVEMISCGLCHSDVHLRDGDEPLPDGCFPLVLGHEGVGRVVSVGTDTPQAPAIGTRVGLPWLYDTCRDCRPCLSGAETFCAAQRARGVHVPGALAQYALLDAAFGCEIPDGIDSMRAAPLLCAGLTAWSALNKTRLSPSSSVLVVGAGGLGQHAIMIARARGARVIVLDRDADKRQRACELGAHHSVATDADAVATIRELGGADVVLNFAPSPDVWNTIVEVVNPMSDIVAVALVRMPVELSMMWLIDGGHRVFGSSVGSRQELRDYLDFCCRHTPAQSIESVRLCEVDDALDRLKAGQVDGRLCVDFRL